MDQSDTRQIESVVEELRLSGFRGLAPWLAELPPRLGTRLIATQGVEVAATQTASLWLESESAHVTLTGIRDCFLHRLLALIAIVERTYPAAESPEFLRQIVEQFELELRDDDCGAMVVSLLVASMVLRQIQESSDPSRQTFVPHSNHVHPAFFARCVDALGWTPFDANEQSLLTDVRGRINDWQRSREFPTNSPKTLAS